MSAYSLTAGISLNDRMQPLLEQQVANPKVKFKFDIAPVDSIFWRALHSDDFDVAEMSLAAHCILCSRDDTRFVGLPIFTSRMFRHGSVYISRASGITAPAELRGRTIGVPEYQMTAAVWMRGILQEFYDVDPKSITWLKGGVNTPGRKERLSLNLPSEYSVREIPAEDTLDDYLVRGAIDGLITAKMPESFRGGNPAVCRLFPDARHAEEQYFRATGVFPIMHLLVMRRALYEKDPSLVAAIYEAFSDAKKYTEERLLDPDALAFMVPWLVPEMERTYGVLGRDFWPYGIDKNLNCLSSFIRYLSEQKLLRRSLCVKELFAEELVRT